MGELILLTAGDNHSFAAYQAQPSGPPRGSVVVVQEIFGINQHIRNVADDFASEGYLTIAPALFDRVERNVELGYAEQDLGKAFTLRKSVPFEKALLDIEAAVKTLSAAGRVGIVGYCWGGTLAWLAAAGVAGISAVSSYYGGGIGQFAKERPKCPVQFHFGARDKHIPSEEVDAVRKAQPGAEVYTYPADHGFSCDARPSYDAAAARLARQRTLGLFAKALG